jgi:RNA polymerase sigma-70 factor (ECF subfamily)
MNWVEQQDDAGLIALCRQGQDTAFDALVLRHQNQAYAVALRMLGDPDDAKDVAQDAFVRAYRSLESFRGEAKFSTWLIAIVMNLCRNKRRWWMRRKRLIVASIDAPVETEEDALESQVADPSPGPASQVASHETQARIAEALGMLDDDSREVVVLRDVQGLAYDEIARLLGCELGTVKSRLARARMKLRGLLDGRL